MFIFKNANIPKVIIILSFLFNIIITRDQKRFQKQTFKHSVHHNEEEDNYYIQNEYDTDSVAYCTYEKTLMEKGWETLAISSYQGTKRNYSDEIRSFAMGYLEGYITAEKIWLNYLNQKKYYFHKFKNEEMPESTRLFLKQNSEWVLKMAKENKENDPFWNHAFLIHKQLEGMLKGYNEVIGDPKKILTLEDLNVLNAGGDLEEISYYEKSLRPDFEKMTLSKIRNHIEKHSHCSSLIKVAPDFSDVWFGHNTWTNYSSMLRIFKEYRFKSYNKSEKATTVAFSSYPGSLSSIDDFYITNQDLFITESTNTVFDMKLFDLLTPESLLTWHRTMISNRLSNNAKTWTENFARYNSGTYNNQFQVLDLKLIDTKKKEIKENAFWIIEQIPGYTESGDMTNILRQGYWPSYNSAYFDKIRKFSGYDDQLIVHPELKDTIDYESCARANIFRRDQDKVIDLDSFKKLLRYNNFKNDVLSKNDPGFAIACRRDLDEKKPECRGATDAKVSSIHDIKGMMNKKIYMISGPTSDDQPIFDVSNAKCMETGKYVFNGLPTKFDFSWVEYETFFME